MEKKRCPWARDELEIAYHDDEWCKPEHDDRKLFELLVLEGMQAGLSWLTILRKRENMRAAFDGFDPAAVAEYGEAKTAELLQNPGIIRNRAKLAALVANARAFRAVQREFGSFDRFLWGFAGNRQVVNAWTEMGQMPAASALSERLSAELKRRGFQFVGPTICYSYLQAAGVVNDHMTWCCEYRRCSPR